MQSDFLIVHKSVLPDYFDAVLRVKKLLEERPDMKVTQAAKLCGISRSTFYKYKDYVFDSTEGSMGKKAVLGMLLTHRAGVLSSVLAAISESGANVLTITQSPPIANRASVTISVDMSGMSLSMESLIAIIGNINGVTKEKVIAVE